VNENTKKYFPEEDSDDDWQILLNLNKFPYIYYLIIK
jgi:hypothetical protein